MEALLDHSANHISKAITIMGKVQGVGFRAWMRTNAQNLGLTGFVQNLPDGSVYAEVTGNKETVNKLEDLCHVGPANARVEKVISKSLNIKHEGDFRILRANDFY